MNTSHTATPWKIYTALVGDNAPVIGADGKAICGMNSAEYLIPAEEKIANAAFIVRAVNSHDALVGALEEAKQFMPTYARVAKIEAVLAAAKGDK